MRDTTGNPDWCISNKAANSFVVWGDDKDFWLRISMVLVSPGS